MVQRKGALLEALFRISKGFFFGPHHLIMAALLYFEKKVHRKKLLRADATPLLFPRLLCQILEHLGYPSNPQLERRRICRRYSLSTNGRVWQHMVQSRKPQLDQNIQTFHIQSSQRSHNQLRYRWYESTCPCSALFRAYTWGCTLCSSWHTTDSSCYSTHIRAISFIWA